MTKDQVRNELKLVTIFYTRSEAQKLEKLQSLASKYDRLASELEKVALIKLYDFKYHQGLTLEACARKFFYSLRYVELLHSELIKYFTTQLNK